MNKNSAIGIAAVVLLIVALVFGGWVIDQNRRAAQAAEKVEEFSTRCDSAPDDFDADYSSTIASWQETVDNYSETHYLGDLLTSPSAAQNQIITICAETDELAARLENGEDRVAIYNDAEASLGQLNKVVFATSYEWAEAKGAIEWLESAETWQVEAYSAYENRPSDAVDPGSAYDELDYGDAELENGWGWMAYSDWASAQTSASNSIAWYQQAIEHSSSPTPTPEPTNTPSPTATDEPYAPPPTSSWDWSSDDTTTGSTDYSSPDSNESTDGYTDSGAFDDPSSDSGAFDDPPEEPEYTDSGSWKVAPTPEPRRK